MIRRDFFKSLAAASAAFYAGAKTVAVAVPPPAPITKAADVPARRVPSWKNLHDDPQRAIREMLKACAAVSISYHQYAFGVGGELKVEYRYSSTYSYPTNLNEELSRWLHADAVVKTVAVEAMIMNDIIDLNHGFKKIPAMRPENRIVVTWLVPTTPRLT